jgi:hypothetical protein
MATPTAGGWKEDAYHGRVYHDDARLLGYRIHFVTV